jgi:hypothetical protein
LEQKFATSELLVRAVSELIADAAAREKMQSALAQWHSPKAAEEIAECILQKIAAPERGSLPRGESTSDSKRTGSETGAPSTGERPAAA